MDTWILDTASNTTEIPDTILKQIIKDLEGYDLCQGALEISRQRIRILEEVIVLQRKEIQMLQDNRHDQDARERIRMQQIQVLQDKNKQLQIQRDLSIGVSLLLILIIAIL